MFTFSSRDIDSYVWHLRLDHINKDKMHKNGLIPNLTNINFEICSSCIQEKMTRKLFTNYWH